jgi:hypothetical protein
VGFSIGLLSIQMPQSFEFAVYVTLSIWLQKNKRSIISPYLRVISGAENGANESIVMQFVAALLDFVRADNHGNAVALAKMSCGGQVELLDTWSSIRFDVMRLPLGWSWRLI